LRQIDQPQAHHAMDSGDWAALDHPRNGLAMGIIELRGLARRFAVQQAVRPPGIEPQHPISNDLKPDAAHPCCLGAWRSIINCRQRQQSSCLRAILGLLGKAAQLLRRKIPT
jgi:hypothetical protein